MSQRTIAALAAVPLVIGLLITAWRQPLPYATYQPGLTVDVLGAPNGSEIIQVDGRKTYPDEGELRFTTVIVSLPKAEKNIFELMSRWISREDAVYPYDAIHGEEETPEQSQVEGAIDMVTSQDAATAVALNELGIEVESAIEVVYVDPAEPADGKLKVGDVFRRVNGKLVKTDKQLVETIRATPAGKAVTFTVLRGGKEVDVEVVPVEKEGRPQVGVQLGIGFVFPFEVQVNIDPNIGGPSAGLMFSLAIYDTLTPGSLGDGKVIAGTGTISAEGAVGPIGGVQQKIVGARDDGAELFMVPPDNCADALGAANGEMQLVKATTMHAAVEAITAWTEDPEADLPSCEAA